MNVEATYTNLYYVQGITDGSIEDDVLLYI
jgi:hypothetical protein